MESLSRSTSTSELRNTTLQSSSFKSVSSPRALPTGTDVSVDATQAWLICLSEDHTPDEASTPNRVPQLDAALYDIAHISYTPIRASESSASSTSSFKDHESSSSAETGEERPGVSRSSSRSIPELPEHSRPPSASSSAAHGDPFRTRPRGSPFTSSLGTGAVAGGAVTHRRSADSAEFFSKSRSFISATFQARRTASLEHSPTRALPAMV
eukprot:CAMPEP_0118936778 /NCGR_PEP_ID=MMETSP1169-20130426/20422_1 /TAXON_ID=36882 /ORGANISM="Pyramimonas obovata, Strain CCMP722" /LENGTH=210 /DNA_ID=CAMNT_0006880169 /DNA_START=235 /DNA_END=863 /DNA_ORIENTATION=-